MNQKMIIDAYCKIRTIDQTIPDDVLDFMKDAAIEKLVAERMFSKTDMERAFVGGASNAAKLRVSGNKLTLPVLEFKQWIAQYKKNNP